MTAQDEAYAYDRWVTGNFDGGQTDAEKERWECPVCGTMNSMEELTCEDCDEPQPNYDGPDFDDDDDRPYEGSDQYDTRCFHSDGSVSYHD
jgi:hypothetical protein